MGATPSSPAKAPQTMESGVDKSAVDKPAVDESAVDHELGQQTPPSHSTFAAEAPRPPQRPLAPDQRSTSDRVIQLQLGRDIFELSGQSSYLVGRRDLDQQLFPDVDLHEWDGAAAGVSRRHIMIRVIGNIVSIEDLESRNSTILNGYRLFPHQQYPLVDTDEVRMGDITLLVRIVSSN
ncbi:MAG: FHA domain-containing protein [Ktedonobacterales bacterium]